MFTTPRILMTGGTGLLGKELLKINPNIEAPSREWLDLDQTGSVLESQLRIFHPFDMIIHAAAFTDLVGAEENARHARSTNIGGTVRLLNYAERVGVRLVYISTDYVFHDYPALKGRETTDPINPQSKYAMTKAAGELAVRTYPNSLCIRTSFCPRPFPHPVVVEQFTNKDYVDVIARLVYKYAISDLTGIAHVGTHEKFLPDLAEETSPGIERVPFESLPVYVPRDSVMKLTPLPGEHE